MAIGNPITLTNNVAAKVISATATANQTLFTVTGGYRINQIAVFRNGVRLVDSSDYTARDGASVTLLSAATEGDVLEFQIFDDFRVADAIVSNESEQTISGSLNVTGGINVGIQSAGTQITTGVITAINFVGTGNTVQYDSSSKTVAVSIAGGGGGGGLGTAIKYSDETTDHHSVILIDCQLSRRICSLIPLRLVSIPLLSSALHPILRLTLVWQSPLVLVRP